MMTNVYAMPNRKKDDPWRQTSAGVPSTVTADMKLAVRDKATGPQVICLPPTKKSPELAFFRSLIAKKIPMLEETRKRAAKTKQSQITKFSTTGGMNLPMVLISWLLVSLCNSFDCLKKELPKGEEIYNAMSEQFNFPKGKYNPGSN